jgi:tetratricopeptide (TPR) repeat protein
MRAGADSLRLTASLVDVVSGQTLEVEVRDEADRIERMGDSVTVRLLRKLGTIRPIAAVARASMLSRSLAALKAFLKGEQLYRANQVLAARDEYQNAINADTGFALAYHRMRGVWRAIGSENDSTGYAYARLAGERNHGLAPRDSLLILADSLAAAKAPGSVFLDDAGLAQLHRRVAALELAAKRYPDDAEVQFELGEAAYHIGERVGLSQQRALAAFLKAIRLDPKFMPAYYHAIELSPSLDSTETAIRLAQGYDELNPREHRYGLFARLLRVHRSSDLDRAIAETDRLPVDAVVEAIEFTRRWPDSLATAVKLSQRLLRRPTLTHDDSARARFWLTSTLLFRGRLGEAREAVGRDINADNTWNLTELARFRAVPPDTAVEMGRRWAERVDDRGLYLGIPLLELSRDSVSLYRLISRFHDQLSSSRSRTPQVIALIGTGSAHARLQLLRGDSDGALREFQKIPDSLCSWWCADDRLTTARLLLAKGMRTQALEYLNRHPPGGGPTTLEESLWLYERSRAERATSPSDADRDFSFVRRALSHADPSIQAMLHLGQPTPAP